MENLQMFDVMTEGYNRLAGQIGHYTGKAVIVGATVLGIASLF